MTKKLLKDIDSHIWTKRYKALELLTVLIKKTIDNIDEMRELAITELFVMKKEGYPVIPGLIKKIKTSTGHDKFLYLEALFKMEPHYWEVKELIVFDVI